MNDQLNREETVFHAAVQLAPEKRAAYLALACGDDKTLRRRIEALLQAEAAADPFFRKEALHVAMGADPQGVPTVVLPVTEKPGDRIGRYKLLQQIGEGGCGVVYVAEQEEPVRRRVALKVIKLGMDTKSVIARFEAERQALALMDHPNIAKVLDAGATETGRPFFVMELVRGIKITDYCDQNNLPTRERLALFIQVCHAIQHAHQKGIIHRDIKPSNILVTLHDGEPVPKVIDFGIAKATTQQRLTDKTVYTAFEQFIGTPAYMSPEQAEMSGLDIDTRSDIYALGVLLYELLTGKTPFDPKTLLAAGLEEMRRIIREQEPVRPSTRLTQQLVAASRQSAADLAQPECGALARRRYSQIQELIPLLRGDLDWIVMKALEKDRTRRYETANGLAMDIERHLKHEPVVARPPSMVYRAQKFIRRNKLMVGAASLVALALVLGIALSTWQAIRASRLRVKAEANEQRALQAQANEVKQRQAAEAEKLRARHHAYAADMNLAQQALSMNNLGDARRLLDGQRPGPGETDLRGWEWRHLWQLTRGDDIAVLRGHSSSIMCAGMLPDGRTVVSVGLDRTIRFCDSKTGLLSESIPHQEEVHCAALSPDGRWLAVGGGYGYWSLRDTGSRQLRLARTNSTGVRGAAFSPDGSRVALVDDVALEVWEIPKLEIMKRIDRHTGGVSDFRLGVAFSPDSSKVAYVQAISRLVLHDLATGSEEAIGEARNGGALTLAFTQDGRILVSGDRLSISLWDVRTRTLLRHLTNHLEQTVSVALSPDGGLMASASGDQTVRLWDTKSWQELRVLRGHEHEVYSVGFSPDGKTLISCGRDLTVRLWNVEADRRRSESYAWPAESWLIPAFPGGGRQLQVRTGDRELRSLSFFDLMQLEEGSPQPVPAELRSSGFAVPTAHPTQLPPYSVAAASADLSHFAVPRSDGSVELWSTEPLKKLKVVRESPVPVDSLALGKTGKWLAVGRSNRETELFDLGADRLVQRLPPLEESRMNGPTNTAMGDIFFYDRLSFWAEDRVLARATPRSRHTPTLIEVLLIPEGEKRLIRSTHEQGVCNFAISPDRSLVATCAADGQVKLWDISTAQEIYKFGGQLIGFMSVAFSSDSSRLAAGGWDGSILLWDLATRQQVARWKPHTLPTYLCFLEEGEALLSATGNWWDPRETRLWRAPSLAEIDAVERSRSEAR